MEAKTKERLYELARKLTLMFIPYHPPLKGLALKNLEKNNPKGYYLLMEYLDLVAKDRKENGYVVETVTYNSQGHRIVTAKRVYEEDK